MAVGEKPVRTRVLIMRAAGRDFHNFNVVFRDDPGYDVVAFTAAQIPNIEGRSYPPELAGTLYPHGIPIYLLVPLFLPLMLLECIGLVTKPFALMIRLYANMYAGHMVMLSIFGMIFVFQSWAASGVIVLGVLGFFTMEIAVAFIQAYIFTYISSMVIGVAIHPQH